MITPPPVLLDTMQAQIHPSLVDGVIDAYVDWREECSSVRTSYDRWASCSGTEAASAFLAYRAALDREERASRVYAERIGRIATGHSSVA